MRMLLVRALAFAGAVGSILLLTRMVPGGTGGAILMFAGALLLLMAYARLDKILSKRIVSK